MPNKDAIALWQSQSKLMWSRIQTATVIEAAVIGGWYQLWNAHRSALAIAILILGAFFLLVVSYLMHRDGQYMTACESLVGSSMPDPGPPRLKLKGRQIAYIVPIILALCDIALIFTQNFFAGQNVSSP